MTKSKSIWEPGIPVVPGIYWFDNGLRIASFSIHTPLLLQVRAGDNYCHGPGGGGIFRVYYDEKICKAPFYAHLPQPKKWDDLSIIKEDNQYAWFKHPKGYMGVGILSPGWNDNVTGTWIWLNHPTNASDGGQYVRAGEDYQFSLIKAPKLPKKPGNK